MRVGLEKASGRAKCRYEGCQRKTEYISEKGRIKKDTICAWISTQGPGGWHTSYYCRDCIEKIYAELKKILNPNLWVFH
jgi:hypothetical protein